MAQERKGNRRGPLLGEGLLPRTLSTCWGPKNDPLNCTWRSRGLGKGQDSPATKSPKPMVEMVMKE